MTAKLQTPLKRVQHTFFPGDPAKVLKKAGPHKLVEALRLMMRVRNFEMRAESAYQQGKIGGFFHSYIGQEAIQVAALQVMGAKTGGLLPTAATPWRYSSVRHRKS